MGGGWGKGGGDWGKGGGGDWGKGGGDWGAVALKALVFRALKTSEGRATNHGCPVNPCWILVGGL